MRTHFLIAFCLTVLAPIALANAASDEIRFNRDVRPILSNYCFTCHGPDESERQGGLDGLRLDTEEGMFADMGGYTVIERGKPEESELIRRLRADADSGEIMPPEETGKKLSEAEIELVATWVRQGAPYARHWSYIKPTRPPLPAVTKTDWPRNAIDYFILARLESEGLSPSAAADRYALIRRVSLDLTGLPPTLDAVDQFVDDPREDAYERLVDHLLASDTYGEHWARMWLDLARYADSAGYADDPPRTIWFYRDYVIQSLNDNVPFDQFTIEQIAGDLLPNPSERQLVATAFHRNTMTNNEGGTNDEEFRNVAIVDRVNTTMAVWMGTTMACAQCHNHKYDPISQEEYFRFFAILNNTQDADRRDESPLIEIYSEVQKQQRAAWKSENADQQLAEQKPLTTVPVMAELPEDKRRKTHVQYRGSFMDLGPEVGPAVPAAFHPLAGDAEPDRLTLAKWLVDEENPLTARVIANRYWEQIFGIGIVRTSEDFGSQGDRPSHPNLLDWLATELVASGWDLKHLLKTLVTSSTYRQSSRVSEAGQELDPDNRLLWRGPRFRMSAEMIRDQALMASGLLSSKMNGPPVRPPRPTLGLKAAFGGSTDWKTSEGSDRYRRAVYTEWRRSLPYPSMATFDAPNRQVCMLRRERTNTPLQALVTLNDPVYVEAAQALARRMANRPGDADERVRYGFRLCLSRHPDAQESNRLVQLYETARDRFRQAPDRATAMATDPLGPVPEGSDTVDLAAWTVVGNVLLNLDETLMKR